MSAEPLPSHVIINGVVAAEAVKLDGTNEAVSVRLIPIRLAEDYFVKEANMAEFVELSCSKPAGWADSLTDDSLYQLDRISRDINDPRFDRLMSQRQVQVVAALAKMARPILGEGSTK